MTVLEWLLDGDPSIRWQALRDLTDAPDDVVAAERGRVAHEGWGAQLLARQQDGQWDGGACFPGGWFESRENQGLPGQPWTSTLHTLQLLTEFGVDPADERVKKAIEGVKENCFWEHDGQPFFEGEVEPCINGRTVALGVYFGQNMDALVERLLGEQLEDGGWNCEAENGSVRSSFHSTMCVLDGLLAYERATGKPIEARHRGEEYLLERNLLRRKGSGEVINPRWREFSFPVRWHYDVLRALDYFREAGGKPDQRMAEAIEHVQSKQPWPLENTHPGKVFFAMEEDGQPSRWNTLRALRVLKWYFVDL